MLFVVSALLLQPGAAATPDPAAAPPQTPSGLELVLAMLPGLLMLAVMPLFLWLLKRLQHSNYALGLERTQFDAPLGSFYGLALKTLGVSLVAIAAVVALVMGGVMLTGAWREMQSGAQVIMVVVLLLAYLVVFAVAGAFWTARLQNLAWGRTASADLHFASKLSARSLAGLWLKNTVLVMLSLGLYFPFAQVASARRRLQAMTVISTVDPDDLVAAAGPVDEAAAGDAAGDLLGFDIGI
jgi:uncharacterized membrane protein YjgN (DUF898 family)